MSNQDKTIESLALELQELKQAYEALKNTNNKLQAKTESSQSNISETHSAIIYQTAPVKYHSLDENAVIIEVSPFWLGSLGYSREEVIGHIFWEFLSQSSAEFAQKQFPIFKTKGEVHDLELEMIHKNGSLLHVGYEGTISYDKDGNFKQTHCIWTDITKHKKAESLQAENEISYRELFNHVTDAIYIQDEDGTFLDMNEGAVKMYGYPKEVLIGKNPSFVAAPGKNDTEALAIMLKKSICRRIPAIRILGITSKWRSFPKRSTHYYWYFFW